MGKRDGRAGHQSHGDQGEGERPREGFEDHVERVEAAISARRVELSIDGGDWYRGDLAGAMHDALRSLRIEHADELDLTDEEARS